MEYGLWRVSGSQSFFVEVINVDAGHSEDFDLTDPETVCKPELEWGYPAKKLTTISVEGSDSRSFVAP